MACKHWLYLQDVIEAGMVVGAVCTNCGWSTHTIPKPAPALSYRLYAGNTLIGPRLTRPGATLEEIRMEAMGIIADLDNLPIEPVVIFSYKIFNDNNILLEAGDTRGGILRVYWKRRE